MTLTKILEKYTGTQSERTAVICGSDVESYDSLAKSSRKYAAYLRSRGVVEGQAVAILMQSDLQFIFSFFGVLALGGIPIPLNPMLRVGEIVDILDDSHAKHLVYDDVVLEGYDGLGGDADLNVITASQIFQSETSPLPFAVERSVDDVALVLYTSGSTGRPKGVMLTHKNLVSNISATAVSPFALEEDDVLMGCLPLSHTFGLICGMSVCFQSGARMILHPRFDALSVLQQMREHRCTVLMAVPTMLMALLDSASSEEVPTSLERVYCGGSALSADVLHRFEAVFDCTIYEGYGLTEASPVVAYNQPGRPTKVGSVGYPIAGVVVGISNPEIMDEIQFLPRGCIGEVVVQGDNIMCGYLNRPEDTARVVVDGWLRTGDLGVTDDDGYLSIVGRLKDIMIRGGYNVYPREIEILLMAHPFVSEAAVIGVPDDRLGEEVCAILVLHSDVRAGVDDAIAVIDEWLKANVAAYKYPRIIKVVDSLPLGITGKVSKQALLEILE